MTSLCKSLVTTAAILTMCGCGTYVPTIEEIWEQKGGNTKSLEQKIKEKIYCELSSAVELINHDESKIVENSISKQKVTPLPQDWGVTMVLTMTVLENTALSPLYSLSDPYKPVTTRPGGISVTTPQSLSIGIGGTASADATRIDKFTFYYTIKDLQIHNSNCDDKPQADMEGSSLLIESRLGIYDWIANAFEIRAGVGRPRRSTQEVLSYDVKFEVVTGINVTPTLTLVHNSFGGSGNLFATKRDRTHEMLLTFGPIDPNTLKPGAIPQPSALATTDSLSLQVGSAVGSAIRNLREQQPF